MSQEKCTIQAAAKALGVTQKTIYRYLSNGTLSRIREGARTYILVDEVRTLRMKLSETQEKGVITDVGHTDSDIITIKLSVYNDLMKKLGQAEGQEKYLLEYKADSERKAQELATVKGVLDANSAELDQAKTTIAKARNELQRLLEAKRDAELKAITILDQQAALKQREKELDNLRAENERLKRLRWWERLFRRGI